MNQALLEAYRSTEFWVEEVAVPFALRVGAFSEALLGLHRACGTSCSAFLTAWNPGSRPCSEAWNRAAQGRLEMELAAAGFALRRGFGKDPAGVWPGEPSVLALGMARETAESIGQRYGQNAILWTGAEAVPELPVLAPLA